MLISIWFYLIISPVQADGWDDFSNNLATDLAPILSLFGEQITKQYLSESIQPIDYFIFALAPIGILTAVVSAIRVCGSPSLRAFIGRAQEGGGSAEAELCSSTSRDVCELYNNGGIARVFGRPKILEIVHDPIHQDFDGGTAGIHTFQSYILHDRGKEEWNAEDDTEKQQLAPSPNLSLNIGIKRKSRTVFRAVALMGTLLQVGVLAFAAIVTYHLQWEKEGGQPASYACPLTIIGTVLLFCGIFLCAYLIGESTGERFFNRKTIKHSQRSTLSTIYWVQPGGQILGDQMFDSFCSSDYKEPLQQYVTSWKKKSNSSELLLWTAVGTTISGFAIQFTGLRGLHSAVAMAQLGAMLLMSAARAALRMQRLKPEDNYLALYPDIVTGHELDWLAIRLEQVQRHGQSTDDTKVRCLWRFLGVSDGEQRIQKKKPNNFPDGNNSVDRILAYRTRLAMLSQAGKASLRSAALAEHFNIEMVEVRGTAQKVVSAIECAANIIFSGDLAVDQSWKDAESIVWSFDCQVEHNVYFERQSLPRLPGSSRQHPLQLIRPGGVGPWALQNANTLEGILGLWVWSLKFDPDVEVSDTKTNMRLSQATEIRARRIVTTEREIAENELKAWLGGTILKFAEDSLVHPCSRRGSPNTMWQKDQDGRWYETLFQGLREEQYRFFGWHTMKLSSNQHATSITVWSAPTTSSLTTLCAQEIFGSFLRSILGIFDYFSNAVITTDTQDLPLASKLASELVTAFVESGLGTREDALLCISPLLISPLTISVTENGLANAQKSADYLRKQGEWMQAESVLRRAWRACTEDQSFGTGADATSLAAKNTERVAIALGELYRWALLDDTEKEGFGMRGIRWLSQQKPPLGSEHLTCVEKVIDRYIYVAEAIRDASTGRGRANTSALEIGGERATMLINITLSMSKASTPQEKGSALCTSAEHGWSEIVLALLELDAQPDFADIAAGGKTALSYASESGDTDTVTTLLERRASPTLLDSYLWAPLHYAAAAGSLAVVKMLLSNPKVDPDSKNDYGETPLWQAARKGQEAVVRLLAQQGSTRVNVDVRNRNDTTPLMKAAKGGHTGVIRLLLGMETVKPDAVDKHGCTVLWYAASNGFEEITRRLLETSKVNVNAENKAGKTILGTAVENGHGAVVKVLLTVGGATPDSKSLFQAVEQGNLEMVQSMLGTGKVESGIMGDGGQTLLSCAANNGHGAIVSFLLAELGNDPNIQDGFRRTLWLARDRRDEATTELLTSALRVAGWEDTQLL
ncbi:ankyrin repeat-containing domain-containing [Fusarium acutatum]|uniref:Ankyrin repeat-containing domain-containing n=1 Tax=Fusarium acutatum TaxID=78861 RepID=A0A8H4NK76_9HYPO|nr:ankyrin repeat-containing domain-containing [Fusarium acutatum]